MMKRKLFIKIALSAIGMILLMGQWVGQAAAAASDGDRVYISPFSSSNEPLSQAVAVQQQFFQLYDYWNVKEIRFNLDYQISQTSKNNISSMTLSVNGHKFYSFRPAEADQGKQHLSVQVPAEWVTTGVNSILVEGYIRTNANDQTCTQDVGPDNWLQVYDSSGIEVHYTAKPYSGAIQDFHNRFAGPDMVKNGKNAIIIPVDGEDSELETAAYVLSGYAKANTLTDKEIPLSPYSPEQVKDKEAVVLIALYDRLPEEFKKLVDGADLEKKALIRLVKPDTQPTLVITSKNPDRLIQAGRFAANSALMTQLTGDTKWVEEGTDVSIPASPISKIIPLTENGDKLTGEYHQEKSYFVQLPSNRSIADSSKISMDFRYAQNLDFTRSMVTILVNNTPIGSKKLTKELANGDTLTFTIPKNIAVSGNFSVTAAFDLELPSAWCSPNQDQMPWAFITKDSMLQLSTKDRTDLQFEHYPYPFLRDGIYNRVAVVLPEKRDDYTYRTLSNVINLLGHYADGNTGEVKFLPERTGPEVLKDRNLIVIGSYKDNAVIRDINGKLYFRYDSNGSGFLSNEKMSIDADYGKSVGTLQLIPSPYGSGRGLLAVTGAGSEQAYLASKLIANEKNRWKAFGDGILADKDGKVQAHRFKAAAAEPSNSVVDEVLQRSDVLAFTVAVVMVLLLILVSLILLIRKHMKKRGGRE
jgi:cellulose synthase operon protein B